MSDRSAPHGYRTRGIEWFLVAAWLSLVALSVIEGPAPEYVFMLLDRTVALLVGIALMILGHVLQTTAWRRLSMLAALFVVASSFVIVAWS